MSLLLLFTGAGAGGVATTKGYTASSDTPADSSASADALLRSTTSSDTPSDSSASSDT